VEDLKKVLSMSLPTSTPSPPESAVLERLVQLLPTSPGLMMNFFTVGRFEESMVIFATIRRHFTEEVFAVKLELSSV
jgi:hypothetical protein